MSASDARPLEVPRHLGGARVVRPPRGLTALELDPLASISARGFLVVVAVVAIICAVCLTIVTVPQIASWPLAIAALVALVAGFALFVRSAYRFDLGVTSDRFATAYALIAVATVLNSLSCFGTNLVVRDDWGLITIGLALMAAAPFRTSAELGTYTTIAAVLAGVLATLHDFTSFSASPIPLPIVVLVAVAPPLALGLGSMAYARRLLHGIYAERLEQAESRERDFEALRSAYIDHDVLGSIGSLREEIVPFLARVRQAGALTVDDRVRAAELAHTLQHAVARGQQSDSLGDHADVLIDESGLSPRLHEDDRATVRALVSALATSPHIVPGSIILELIEGDDDRFGMVRSAGDDVRALRSDVLPFIRMTRLMFRTATEQVHGDELLIQFDINRLA
ncbi:MAG: hypothetical protein EPO52_00135 [Herbiconiux sp.]|uniref:hypothetical protein n=1 Tax=Herbiconiux sp. TaxID=1871186 RepID=UPI001208F298|nr:hypothetical protein [Herbiconiux sp.]TAJ50268.1 MAG: hypothetical protein EPO52_00135 [Herbiconiux sp.]